MKMFRKRRGGEGDGGMGEILLLGLKRTETRDKEFDTYFLCLKLFATA